MPRLRSGVTLLVASLVALTSLGCSIPTFVVQPVSNSPELEEVVVRRGETKRAKVAVIPVEGLLVNARTGGGLLGTEENPVSLFRQQLARAAADDRVKAVVLRINSPGGTVAASEAMYRDVLRFKQQTGKVVVAASQDVSASGGYYVSCAADEIHAVPGGIVGSIGVIFQTLDASELMAKIGVEVRPITSGDLKDLGSPFDGLSEEEEAVFRGLVDDFFASFVAVVNEHREISDTETAFDGRVFSATQAKEIGLIDEVLDLDSSLSRAAELADAKGATVIRYTRPFGYRGSIYASGDVASLTPRPALPGSEVLERYLQMLEPGAYYLWMP
ncbi:MAG: signal peptide peptidase SppA [Planctomycetota bacterium]